MSSIWKRVAFAAAACGGLALLVSGCGQEPPPDELLLVYSGDCQAYIEPCG